MKKMLALLLALALALSCVSALAEIPGLENGVTLAAAMNMDADMIKALAAGEMDETSAAMLPAVFAVVNNAGLKAAIKGTDVQIDLTLKDASVLTLSLGVTEEGLVLNCDAIPNYAFTVSMETIQQLLAQIAQSMPAGMDSLDPEAIAEAIGSKLGGLVNEIMAKMGETETGAFTVDGMEFNAKIPVNITTKELVTLMIGFVKDLVTDPAFAPILTMAGAEIDPEELDGAIKQLELMDEADIPVTEIAIYGKLDENGDSESVYFVMDMSKDDETIALRAGKLGSHIVAKLKAMDQAAFGLDVEIKDNGATAVFDVESNGIALQVALDGAARADGGIGLRCGISLNGSAPVFTGYLSAVPGAEITAPATAEGKTVITVEDLMKSDETASQNAMAALQSAAVVLAGKAMQAMPDEFNTIMVMINGGQAQQSF